MPELPPVEPADLVALVNAVHQYDTTLIGRGADKAAIYWHAVMLDLVARRGYPTEQATALTRHVQQQSDIEQLKNLGQPAMLPTELFPEYCDYLERAATPWGEAHWERAQAGFAWNNNCDQAGVEQILAGVVALNRTIDVEYQALVTDYETGE